MVILVRTDLNMPKGKIGAQVGHGVQYYLLSRLANMACHEEGTEAEESWLNDGAHTKVCLKVGSLEELQQIQADAKELGLVTFLVTDNGVTMFEGKKTVTALAFAPVWEEEHIGLTSHLKLL